LKGKTTLKVRKYFNREKFRIFRELRGVTLVALARQTGIDVSTLGYIDRITTRLPCLENFVAICEALNLDYFEICDLVYMQPLPGDVVRGFRAACRAEKKTPLQILYELISVYTENVRKRHRRLQR
jgi:transcriptional regulator with XRE-family HTH domain